MRKLVHGCLVGLVGLMTSCSRSADKPAAKVDSPTTKQSDVGGEVNKGAFLQLDRIALTNSWRLRAHDLKQLSARVMVIVDGKQQRTQETLCTWDKKWDKGSPPAVGTIAVALADQKLGGDAGKKSCTLSVSIDKAPASSQKNAEVLLFEVGPLFGERSASLGEARKDPAGDKFEPVIGRWFFVPVMDLDGFNSVPEVGNLDALVEWSRGAVGRTVIALTVDAEFHAK